MLANTNINEPLRLKEISEEEKEKEEAYWVYYMDQLPV